MAAKSTVFDNDFLKLIFNATPIVNIADNASVGPLTTLYISLHTASPTIGGDQTTNEAAYGSYTRVGVARTAGGWTVTGNSVSPVANITFPIATSGTETETFFGVGTDASGAGKLLYFGTVSPTIGVTTGVTPQLTNLTVVTEN